MWQPSWSCVPDAANKFLFPLPKEAPHKIWLCLGKGFWGRFFEIVDDNVRRRKATTYDDKERTPEHGYTIKGELRLRSAYKKHSYIDQCEASFARVLHMQFAGKLVFEQHYEKSAICRCEKIKGADQLCSNRVAEKCLYFHFINMCLPKSNISSP